MLLVDIGCLTGRERSNLKLTSQKANFTTRLIQVHRNSSSTVLPTLIYKSNRSSNNSVTLTHLDTIKGVLMRQPCVDFGSTFNTVDPIRLAAKLSDVTMNCIVYKSTYVYIRLYYVAYQLVIFTTENES